MRVLRTKPSWKKRRELRKVIKNKRNYEVIVDAFAIPGDEFGYIVAMCLKYGFNFIPSDFRHTNLFHFYNEKRFKKYGSKFNKNTYFIYSSDDGTVTRRK